MDSRQWEVRATGKLLASVHSNHTVGWSVISAGDSGEQLYSWMKPRTSLGSDKQYLVCSFINHSSSNTARFMSPIHSLF